MHQCRICLEEQSSGLVSPCGCKGTQKWVHSACLAKWRATGKRKSKRRRQCPECKEDYRNETNRLEVIATGLVLGLAILFLVLEPVPAPAPSKPATNIQVETLPTTSETRYFNGSLAVPDGLDMRGSVPITWIAEGDIVIGRDARTLGHFVSLNGNITVHQGAVVTGRLHAFKGTVTFDSSNPTDPQH